MSKFDFKRFARDAELTPQQVGRLIDKALRKFDEWERRSNLDKPQSNNLYRDYQKAREEAVRAAMSYGYLSQQEAARKLP